MLKVRRECDGDRFDEVWDGVYVMAPLADNEHQLVAAKLTCAIIHALGNLEDVQVFPGTNVSDQPLRWKRNYRCPDVAVFLPGNPAEDRKTHWHGGPDFAVEILSCGDRSRDKFDFYAKVSVRELLLVERKPWRLELHRNQEGTWDLVGESEPARSVALVSAVLPISIRLVAGEPCPGIEITANDSAKHRLA